MLALDPAQRLAQAVAGQHLQQPDLGAVAPPFRAERLETLRATSRPVLRAGFLAAFRADGVDMGPGAVPAVDDDIDRFGLRPAAAGRAQPGQGGDDRVLGAGEQGCRYGLDRCFGHFLSLQGLLAEES